MASILIIGEDPAEIDFDAPDTPKGVSPKTIMDGLDGSIDRLRSAGHDADLLLTKDVGTIERLATEALNAKTYDVIVVGAGLRVLPPMAEHFERLMNVIHTRAPQARLAFNSQPGDSDKAAMRWL